MLAEKRVKNFTKTLDTKISKKAIEELDNIVVLILAKLALHIKEEYGRKVITSEDLKILNNINLKNLKNENR
ncbi:MAG: hypothetical protein ACTSX6_03285 [Candidatus Heimdallarchaeaceae archaeon]